MSISVSAGYGGCESFALVGAKRSGPMQLV